MGDAILIIGAARSGVASAEYLLSIGKQIVISDMNTKLAEDVETQLGHASVSYVWGKQPDVAALQPELIVMSPGVPLSIPPVVKARELGIPVISEPELAFRYSDVPFVAITGTNGKTTTTTLTAFLLEKEGRKVVAGGNIGLPLISQCPQMSANDIVVAEMSSFQLESVDSFCPKVAVVMNLTPDHLDRHKTMEAYAAAKANIFKNQGPEEYLLLNKDDAIVAAMAAGAKSHVYYFSQQEILDEGIWLEDGNLVYRLDKNGAPQVLIPAATGKMPWLLRWRRSSWGSSRKLSLNACARSRA